ncbi:hypothetical protein F0U59_29840 [Archangium gephyra]|nr:hypothetical protein F0U59_29840 [Archangium gephyra]
MKRQPLYLQRFVVLGVVVGVFALMVFTLPWGNDAPVQTPVEPSRLTDSKTPPTPAEHPVTTASEQQLAGRPVAVEVPNRGERPPLMPAELIEQVLKEDKPLGLFMYYHKRVLLDEQGLKEYRKILSDPEMMTAVTNALMESGAGEVEPKEHYHRLMQNDYLEAALNWKDNPQKQKLLELTGNVIVKDNFSSGQTTDRRQMLAGGKMELYRLMHETDVSRTLDLREQARGTRMEKLVTWMAEENLRRLAREEQIRLEMQVKAN